MNETPMNLNFSIKVSATDFPKREISGRIVTWNEVGSTSAGETLFTPNSITFGDSTKLLLEHKREAPIGFLKSYEEDEEGIYATFSIGNTTAGSDALVEASTGLRDGFSVGVLADKYKNEKGYNDPVVTVDCFVAFNGRPARRFIDPDVDLTKIKDGFGHKNWILLYDAL